MKKGVTAEACYDTFLYLRKLLSSIPNAYVAGSSSLSASRI